ncbi:MAG: HPP family protein [Sulfuricella sp.]|nr:HPP family protein [Sulfuricella sp.]
MQTNTLFSFLFPVQSSVTHREKIVSGLGGVLAIFLTTLVAKDFLGAATLPFLLASMGASTVLLLGAPHSPLSQPWSFAGGHLVSAAIGITCAVEIPNVYLAAGLAVGLSISAMYYLRCLHPPGGATALLTVIGDQKIHALGYHFIFMPVLTNVAILLTAALVINNLIPGRRYPLALHLPGKRHAVPAKAPVKLGFDTEDLHRALREMDGYIDVAEEDLTRIYGLATLHAHQRGLGSLTLSSVMTREAVAVEAGARLEQVWDLLRRHGIRGVPVIDGERRVIGMVAIADFLKQVNWRMCETLAQRLKLVFKRQSKLSVHAIMTAPAITATADTPLTQVFLIFKEKGINHLPVIDEDRRLIGIVTRLDLLSALYGDLGEAAG